MAELQVWLFLAFWRRRSRCDWGMEVSDMASLAAAISLVALTSICLSSRPEEHGMAGNIAPLFCGWLRRVGSSAEGL